MMATMRAVLRSLAGLWNNGRVITCEKGCAMKGWKSLASVALAAVVAVGCLPAAAFAEARTGETVQKLAPTSS